LSHYVSETGAKGLDDFNIGPESANLTQNAARHVRAVLEKEFADPDYYDIAVPMHDKKQVVRTQTVVSCRLPHECIMDGHIADDERTAEFEKDNPDFCTTDLARDRLENGYSKSCINPVALYWDGVRYSKNYGFVGLYCENLLSRRKYLIAAVRGDLINVDRVIQALQPARFD
jgi:hypothetical protein